MQSKEEAKDRNALRMREWRLAFPEVNRERKRQSYVRNKVRILEKMREKYQLNKDAVKQRVAEYRERNAEIVKLKKRQDRLEHLARYKQRDKVYHLENKKEISEKAKKYRQRPEIKKRTLERNRMRKALLRSFQQDTDITIDFLIQLRANTLACICGRLLIDKIGDGQAHLDHIIPLSVGGKHERANVRFLCRKCNLTRPKDGGDNAEGINNYGMELVKV